MNKLSIKRVVIAGCRDYNNYEEAKAYIDKCISNIKNENTIVILSGGSSGADKLGEQYAIENGFEIERYPAQWEKFGKSAGPRRNKQMAEVSDYIICFWDGKSKGTKSMIKYAQHFNKPLKVKMLDKDIEQ